MYRFTTLINITSQPHILLTKVFTLLKPVPKTCSSVFPFSHNTLESPVPCKLGPSCNLMKLEHINKSQTSVLSDGRTCVITVIYKLYSLCQSAIYYPNIYQPEHLLVIHLQWTIYMDRKIRYHFIDKSPNITSISPFLSQGPLSADIQTDDSIPSSWLGH